MQFDDETPLVADVATLDFDPRTTTFAQLHANIAELMHETADYLATQDVHANIAELMHETADYLATQDALDDMTAADGFHHARTPRDPA